MLQRVRSERSRPAHNYHFVQNYVRENPNLALDYFAALVGHNARRYNPRGPFSRAWIYWSDVVDAIKGSRLGHQRAMFLSNLEERAPLAAHVIPCIDPLHSFLLNNSAGYLFVGPRVGGALLGSSATLTSAAAEDDLSKHMQVPVIIVAGHFDSVLSEAEAGALGKARYMRAAGYHAGEHNCGCAAITGATTLVQQIAAGLAPALHETDGAKAHYVHGIANAIAGRAKAVAEADDIPLDDWNRFSMCVLKASILHTVEIVEATENDPANRHGLQPRIVFGCYVDNRTGNLTVCTDRAASNWAVHRPPPLRGIEKQFETLASGRIPCA
jgi:hypothetical protein